VIKLEDGRQHPPPKKRKRNPECRGRGASSTLGSSTRAILIIGPSNNETSDALDMIARAIGLSESRRLGKLATADGIGAEGIARSAPRAIVRDHAFGLTGPWAHAPATI